MPGDQILPKMHEDDTEELAQLRRMLAGWRVTNLFRQKDITAKAGLGDVVVSAIERGEPGPMRLANLCKYASVFSLAIEVTFEGLELAQSTPELVSLWNLSQADPYNALWLETWVVRYLRQMRRDLQISAVDMAARLGLKADVLTKWELEGTEPHLYRMMAYARELGGRIRLSLAVVS